MKFLLSWVRDYLELSLPAQALADRLTLAGLEVNSLQEIDGDWRFEAEVTPNRPDLLSHLGIARETAAVLGRQFRFPRWLDKECRLPRLPDGKSIPVSIDDPIGCRRYVGIVIEGVEVKPSPAEMTQRLERLGIRSINNLVDVTNYCMMEFGQPMHAFDLDRLGGGPVHIRAARAGETLVTLDGDKRTLSAGTLVIADAEHPVALAGVMGGKETEISGQTRRLFLEAAWFSPSSVRRTVRETKISSESSYRFERGVDLERTAAAAIRAARMIVALGGGKITAITDAGESGLESRAIVFKPKKAREILGIRATSAQQKKFLERIGCRVVPTGRGLKAEVPSWRADLKIPEDLNEEIARLWGYDRCPATLPPLPREELRDDWTVNEDPAFVREEAVRAQLASSGYQEILSYSLVHPDDHGKVRIPPEQLLELWNPLSREYSVMRSTLLIGALQTVSRNLNRKAASAFQLFEIGSIYRRSETQKEFTPDQPKRLALLVAGTPAQAWGEPSKPLELLHLKGVIRQLFSFAGISVSESVRENGNSYYSGPVISFEAETVSLGVAGKIDPAVAAAYEIPAEVALYYAELDLEKICRMKAREHTLVPLPKVAPVLRDLAVLISEDVSYAQLMETILLSGKPLLENAELFDLYKGKQVPAGKKSAAFRLVYSTGDKTLTEEEVQAAHQKIVQALSEKFQAVLR